MVNGIALVNQHAQNRQLRDRQHISKSNTSRFETPASSRRFFFLAIRLYRCSHAQPHRV